MSHIFRNSLRIYSKPFYSFTPRSTFLRPLVYIKTRFINTMTANEIEPSFTAACCIIGDEILNGKTRESNGYFLSRFLFDMGVTLKRVEVIGDDYEAIAETITRLSSQHDIVFTSGGIGPTHDDISYDAIAKAYSLPLKLDEETCELMKAKSIARQADWKLTEPRKRMALFPHPAKILRVHDDLWVPIVVVNENIHILPGIPRLFEMLVTSFKPYLEEAMAKKQVNGKYYRLEIATKLHEGLLAPFLTAIQESVKEKHIKIGSYPKWIAGPDGEKVVISVIGKDEASVIEVSETITKEVNGWKYVKRLQ